MELDLALTSEREAKMRKERREAMGCRERSLCFLLIYVLLRVSFHFISFLFLLAGRERERDGDDDDDGVRGRGRGRDRVAACDFVRVSNLDFPRSTATFTLGK